MSILWITTPTLGAAGDELVPSVPRVDPVDCVLAASGRASPVAGWIGSSPPPLDCVVDCVNKISGATVGYVNVLEAEVVEEEVVVVHDKDYKAFGVFAILEPETNAAGQVIQYKYKIREGFTGQADRCYDDDEPAPVMHEEQI